MDDIAYKNEILYCHNCKEDTYHKSQGVDNKVDNELLYWSRVKVPYICIHCQESQDRNIYIFFHGDSNKVHLGKDL
jgi:hypothetical protein